MLIFLELKNNFEKNDNYSFDLFEIASKIDSLKHKKTENKSKNGITFLKKTDFTRLFKNWRNLENNRLKIEDFAYAQRFNRLQIMRRRSKFFVSE